MTSSRRYKLLCPIARALDRVGDRWTLLILRDLHAGPARFSDLLSGLRGIASNLLTDRLTQLIADGLVRKREADFGVALYELTDLGERSGDLLFELAMFGGRFPPDDDIRPPGNLRTIAVTLTTACRRVLKPDDEVTAELNVDGELFTLTAGGGAVNVRQAASEAPDVSLTTAYEPMVAAGDGRLDMETFVRDHVSLASHTPGKDAALMDLLGRAMTVIARDDALPSDGPRS